jgi:hypothetical protein
MATNDDPLPRPRVQPKLTLVEMKPATARHTVLETREDTGSESSAAKDFASLPQPGSPYDAAHSRADNKPVPTLRFVMGDTIRGFPYANYDSIDWLVPDKPGASPAIVIRFTDRCVLLGRRRTSEPTVTADCWILSGCYRKPFTA